MKKISAIICAVVLVLLCFSACSNSIDGKWKLESVNIDEIMGSSNLVKYDFNGDLDMNADKSFTMTMSLSMVVSSGGPNTNNHEFTSTMNGIYEVNGETVKLNIKHTTTTQDGSTGSTDDEENIDGTFKDGKLYFEKNGMKMTFKK